MHVSIVVIDSFGGEGESPTWLDGKLKVSSRFSIVLWCEEITLLSVNGVERNQVETDVRSEGTLRRELVNGYISLVQRCLGLGGFQEM
jgi:hypothetical protein